MLQWVENMRGPQAQLVVIDLAACTDCRGSISPRERSLFEASALPFHVSAAMLVSCEYRRCGDGVFLLAVYVGVRLGVEGKWRNDVGANQVPVQKSGSAT